MKPFHLEPAMLSFGGIFYPTGYLFLMLPSARDAQAAADMLVNDGYDIDSITLLTPELIREQLARVDGHDTVMTTCAAEEANTVRRFLDLAERGHHALMVHAPTCRESDHIMQVLKGARISLGQKYRPVAIERLVEQAPQLSAASD